MVAYVWVTRAITEWRTKLRREMNELDGKALSRAVDSLLNYETVKYFGAEKREEARYTQAARAYAEAAVKMRKLARPAQHGAGGDHQCAGRRGDGLHRVGLEHRGQ